MSAWLALASFAALVLVPWLKYPASPLLVGEPETIAYRTQSYTLLLLTSLFTMVLAGKLRTAWSRSLGTSNASLAAGAVFVAVVVAAALPSIDEMLGAFPAALLWKFWIAALGVHAVL